MWTRTKATQALYNQFKPLVRKAYGDINTFVQHEQLGWKDLTVPVDAPTYFRADMSTELYAVTESHFPQARTGGKHYLLWSKVSFLDRSLSRSDEEWREVNERGIIGIVGETTGVGYNAGSEIRKFVECRWPGAIFFLKPPAQQSVAGIAHVHIIVK